jgi:hypothetical protein
MPVPEPHPAEVSKKLVYCFTTTHKVRLQEFKSTRMHMDERNATRTAEHDAGKKPIKTEHSSWRDREIISESRCGRART